MTGKPLRIVTERPAARHAEVRRFWAAARARLAIAERLDRTSEAVAAIPLYREGMVALAGAAVAAIEGDVKPADVADFDAAWSALERVWPRLGVEASLDRFTAGRDLLRATRAIDAPVTDASDALAELDVLSKTIERAIEPRTLRALRARRALRIGAVATTVVVGLAWAVPPLFAPTNVARGKPVKLSSSYPDSLAPADGTWIDNGKIERVYGAQTGVEDNPFIQIDLEKETPIKRVVVYNRGDGWFTDCLPLELALGDDESKLHAVAHRDHVFTQFRPWVVEPNETARFLRLTKRGHSSCALSEVEVYSR